MMVSLLILCCYQDHLTSIFQTYMSKINSIKQEKRYRNETMNVLYHLSNKTATPTLADKSIKSFKANKQQEVQSSRLSTRGDTSLNIRKRFTNSKSKEHYHGFDKYDRGEKMIDRNSSKSLSSKNGKAAEIDRTKKNSYSKGRNEVELAPSASNWGSIVNKHFEKRLKRL